MTSDVSLLRRLGAISYDVFLAFSLAFCVVGIILIIFFEKQAQTDVWIFFVYLITIYLYFTWSWVKGGQTLGMKAWKFHIEQHNTEPITQQQAFMRFVISILLFLPLGFGLVYQLFDRDNLALNDRLSNTRLMKNPKT